MFKICVSSISCIFSTIEIGNSKKKMDHVEICKVLQKASENVDLLQLDNISETLMLEHERSDKNLAFCCACQYGHLKLQNGLLTHLD